MTKHELIQEELETLAEANNGLLRPGEVVKFAQDENTALHSCFEWDDSRAARAHRLWQARRIIKMHVTIIEEIQGETRMFVSLPGDRIAGGGYRLVLDVLSNEQQRREMLNEAHRQFKYWQARYRQLNELVPVFEAMDRVMAEQPELVTLPEIAQVS